MSTGRRVTHPAGVLRWGVFGACLFLLAACGGTAAFPMAEGSRGALPGVPATGASSTPSDPPQPIPLRTANGRASGGVVAGGLNAPYNYAPSVMRVGGGYRMWWCSQLPGAARPGDQILGAAAASPDGPFLGATAPADFEFGNVAGGFDALHTCDPSVIALNGTYYLYYTGTSDPAGRNNAIGLATSTDGTHWARANGGRPIVTAANDVRRANAYAVGQPSAVYLDGWYYLMFTDTTGAAATASGSGQFVLRAKDAGFVSDVEALGPNGFVPVSGTATPRRFSVFDGFTADWMWVDALNAFAIADDTGNGMSITFWDKDFRYHPYQPITIAGPWQEGPGLVRRPDGHAVISATDPCGTVPFDVIRATQPGSGPTGLRHFGLDAVGVSGCANRAQALDVLNGFGLPSPNRTVDLVVDGVIVEVERRSVALALASGMLDSPVAALAGLRAAANISAAVAAVVAPGRPVALVLPDGTLWPVGSPAVATLNSSAITVVTAAQWDAYPRGLDLTGLRG